MRAAGKAGGTGALGQLLTMKWVGNGGGVGVSVLTPKCVAVHGRTGTFLNEIEISGHSSVAWENGRWGTKLAYGLWVADAAAPLIGASAGGGMGTRRRAGGRHRVLLQEVLLWGRRSPLKMERTPIFDMWPLCKVRFTCARFGNYQDLGGKLGP